MGTVNAICFKEEYFQHAVYCGYLDPPTTLTPFVELCPHRYGKMARINGGKTRGDDLRKRLSREAYEKLLPGLRVSDMAAHHYFPAYFFFADSFLNHEWLAMVDWNKYHRDHALHQAQSLYVGYGLLAGNESGCLFGEPTLLFKGQRLLDLVVKTLRESDKCQYLFDYLIRMGAPREFCDRQKVPTMILEEMFLSAFYLATLYHDIGYPWRFLSQMRNILSPHTPHALPLGVDSQWILDHYGKRLFVYPFYGYTRPDHTTRHHQQDELRAVLDHLLNESHGLPGAVVMMYLNELIWRNPSTTPDRPLARFCMDWAAMAVMMHDMVEFFGLEQDKRPIREFAHRQMRLELDRDPLSFVLTLVDQLQDFNRFDAQFTSDMAVGDGNLALEIGRMRDLAHKLGADALESAERARLAEKAMEDAAREARRKTLAVNQALEKALAASPPDGQGGDDARAGAQGEAVDDGIADTLGALRRALRDLGLDEGLEAVRREAGTAEGQARRARELARQANIMAARLEELEGRHVILEYRARCQEVELSLENNTLGVSLTFPYISDACQNSYVFLPKKYKEAFQPFNGFLAMEELGVRDVELKAAYKR